MKITETVKWYFNQNGERQIVKHTTEEKVATKAALIVRVDFTDGGIIHTIEKNELDQTRNFSYTWNDAEQLIIATAFNKGHSHGVIVNGDMVADFTVETEGKIAKHTKEIVNLIKQGYIKAFFPTSEFVVDFNVRH